MIFWHVMAIGAVFALGFVIGRKTLIHKARTWGRRHGRHNKV